MIQLFLKGGPIMWPLLITSNIALTVIIERIIFNIRVRLRRDPRAVQDILVLVKQGRVDDAIRLRDRTGDYLARTMTYAIGHRGKKFSIAFQQAAGQELQRFNRGLAVLDTTITLAPLLGLLGTVIGLIRAFGFLGQNELGSPVAITGGIAEALIATAFGLGIAIMALVPFTYFTAKLESTRQQMQNVGTQLELLLMGEHGNPASGSTVDREESLKHQVG